MQNILESAEFKELFGKHLSAENNGLLTNLLKQAAKDAETVEEQRELLETRDETILELKADIAKHKSFTEREEEISKSEEALVAREKVLATAEINQKVTQLTYELQAEKDKTAFTEKVALGLVRNTEYKKTIFDGETIFHPGHTCPQTGNWVQPGSVNTVKNYNEVETKE